MRAISEKIKNIKWSIVVPLLLIFVLCAINGWFEKDNADFYPINGTYQNQNVWKRIFEGEAPFKDFSAFYGFGQVYVGAFVTWLFGSTYSAGLQAAEFLTMFFFAVLVLGILYCATRDSLLSVYTGLLIVIADMVIPRSLTEFLFPECVSQIQIISRANCNAQMIRAGIVPIVILIVVVMISKLTMNDDAFYKNKYRYAGLLGAFLSVSLLWENCSGVMMYFCFSVVWFFVTLTMFKGKIKDFVKVVLMYIACGIVAFFVLLFVLTHGDVLSWFTSNLSVSSSLAWYYNNGPKIIHLQDVVGDYEALLLAIVGIGMIVKYCFRIWKENAYKEKMMAAIIVSVLAAGMAINYFYAWGSGGSRTTVLVIAEGCVLLGWLLNLIKNKGLSGRFSLSLPVLKKLIGVLGAVSCVVLVTYQLATNQSLYEGVYFSELGGYLDSALAEDVQVGVDTVGDDSLFSTYATAVDVVVGKNQPSGFDYIIHAIGDDNQEKYMEAFEESKPDWVQSIQSEFGGYQLWERNQNWFFYKEMLKQYVPYTTSSYATYWKKQEVPNFSADVSVSTEQVSDSKVKISVSSDTLSPFLTGVSIQYDTSGGSFLKNGLLRKIVQVTDVTYGEMLDGDYFDYIYWPSSGEREIPISVVNGYGEITLEVKKAPEVDLTVSAVEVNDTYDVPYKYIHCVNSEDAENSVEVDDTETVLTVKNTTFNRDALIGAEKLKANDGTVASLRDIQYGDKYIKIYLEENVDISVFQYPTMFEVSR